MMADCYGRSVRVIPESQHREIPPPEKTIPRAGDHRGDFLKACRGGPPAASHFDYAGPFTEMVLLGNLAIALKKKIAWDVKRLTATNAPEAGPLIRPPIRKGWVDG